MPYWHQKVNPLPTYWLLFHLLGEGVEWQDEGLPPPSYLEHINRGYMMGYEVDGYFGTKEGVAFLNDIIARFLITFAELKPQRLEYKPKLYSKEAHYFPKIYKLKELQALRSLSNRVKPSSRADGFEDFVFWAIKLYCEDLIRVQGVVGYEQVESFAFSNFLGKKDRSTLRAKAKSVWAWYEAMDWKIGGYKRKMNQEEYEMTRRERAVSNGKNKGEKARRAVINTVTGIFATEYKKKSGSWHILKIAEATGLDRDTVSKHLKAWEKEKDTI